MIACLAVLEADFQREYRIDLSRALGPSGLSWRRFRSLIAGLSAESGWRAMARKVADAPSIEAGIAHLDSIAVPA